MALVAVLRVRGGVPDGVHGAGVLVGDRASENDPNDGAGTALGMHDAVAFGTGSLARPDAGASRSGSAGIPHVMVQVPDNEEDASLGSRPEHKQLLGPGGGSTGDPGGGTAGDAWRMLHTGSRDGAAVMGDALARIARRLVDVPPADREAQLERMLEVWEMECEAVHADGGQRSWDDGGAADLRSDDARVARLGESALATHTRREGGPWGENGVTLGEGEEELDEGDIKLLSMRFPYPPFFTHPKTEGVPVMEEAAAAGAAEKQHIPPDAFDGGIGQDRSWSQPAEAEQPREPWQHPGDGTAERGVGGAGGGAGGGGGMQGGGMIAGSSDMRLVHSGDEACVAGARCFLRRDTCTQLWAGRLVTAADPSCAYCNEGQRWVGREGASRSHPPSCARARSRSLSACMHACVHVRVRFCVWVSPASPSARICLFHGG